ncbi:hypothetical protein Sru01_19680 [Sphaerisporangium rufum]|uniref:Uncharacterized protein n=1 Tax=Sphaerisporangium rufum TaxID=1381558 RepID=A0A919QZI8_9ACTN|nr:hypothetical protein [Sphaerisporangium rufum]GII76986.1 hypothetical protein Sru01_19680 [Sphaerisporangium rufum]
MNVPSPGAPFPAPGWIAWPLRATATLHLAGVLGQAALAGLFVTGDADLLDWHRGNGGFTHALLYLQLAAAVLLWRPVRGPGLAAAASVLLVAAETLQIFFGQERILAGHFPLGMADFGASALLAAYTWLRVRPTARTGGARWTRRGA